MTRLVHQVIIVYLLIGLTNAVPFTVTASVNGVDPSASTAVITAGETAQINVQITPTDDDVTITQVEFISEPTAMAGILEAFLEKRVEFPKKLDPVNDINAYEIPGILPAGEYVISAKVHYTGSYKGTYDYPARVKVENEGVLSFILGLLIKIMPKAISKPLVGLAI
jgi:hypothetical protein